MNINAVNVIQPDGATTPLYEQLSSILKNNSAMNISNLSHLMNVHPTDIQQQLMQLIQEGKVEMLHPVGQQRQTHHENQLHNGYVYFRWINEQDRRYSWHAALFHSPPLNPHRFFDVQHIYA